MDFFAHQEKARKRTGLYILLFGMALLGIVGVTYLIFAWVNAYAVAGPRFNAGDLWVPELFVWVSLVTIAIVGFATLWKISQLKAGGGAYVAESLGGRQIEPGTQDPKERKLLNIVEEVAIASGVPTPSVYLMDREPGINAFAAGYSPDSAVIGITKGTVDILNRDELQGVIAHEFSHILNGDMRINIRLIGALFGIMALGLLGYYTIRASMVARHQNSRGGGAVVLVMVGFGLMAVGSIGTIFGQLIKAAVSRQREFLADASAVQFTRNPEGIGNALRKIRDYQYGSKMMNAHASEVSHMLFSRGVFSGLTSLFSTHPPINERIERIFGVDAESLKTSPPPAAPTIEDMKPTKAGVAFLSSSGKPDIEQITYAKKLLESSPRGVVQASRDPFGARAVVYGLLLSQDSDVRAVQLDMLSKHSYLGVYRELLRMLPEIDTIQYAARIPLVDRTMPALSMLSRSQYEVFRNNIQELIYADRRIDLFEWVLEKVVVRYLDAQFMKPKKALRGVLLENSTEEIIHLLSILSKVGHNTPEAFEEALQAGLAKLNIPYPGNQEVDLDLRKLNHAIEHLDHLGSKSKKKLLEACMECIHYDKKITIYEAELFRAFGDALGIPVPLLIPSDSTIEG